MASKSTSSRVPPSAGSGVRRNLFHHHLSRRPTSTSATASVTTAQELLSDNSSEIVMRDPHGNYAVQIPHLPPLEDGQPQEDEATEKEKIEARLLEMYKNRSIPSGDPAELLSAVQSSLRRKVASLDDDKWIYEADRQMPS